MSRLVSFLLFFAIALGVLALAHGYLWMRLVRDPAWPSPYRQLGTAVIITLGLGLPLGMVLSRLFEGTARPVVYALFVWMGLMFLLVVVLGAGDAARLATSLGRRLLGSANAATGVAPVDEDRRLLFARAWAGMALLLSGSAGALGMHGALSVPSTKRVRFVLSRLPQALSGLTIVQISDLHIGNLLGRDWLEGVVAHINALSPDVVAITGDLVDGSVEELRAAVEPLTRLRARHGVYFVTGNHEYYSGVDDWLTELRRLGIRVLHNERVSIGDGDASFDLAGIDDASAHRFGHGHGADLPRALAGYDRRRELVLLAHQPKAVFEAAQLGVGLQLSGHTHGGQIFPFGWVVRLTQPFLAGVGQVGDTQIYTSRGTGFWGPPMRIGAPPEITQLELVAPAAPSPSSAASARP
jgi:predicted MPP superfamily phosphohydrolase